MVRSEMEKAMARTPLEGIAQTLSKLGVEMRRVSRLDQGETAMRSQGRGKSD